MNPQKETWQITNSQQIYQDPWLRLRVDGVVRANGLQGKHSVVEFKGGIGVVPITETREIVLVGQYRYAPDVYSWEIPKGAFSDFDASESPLATAQRELEEETGITAGKWQELTMVHTLLGSTNDKVFLFLATELQFGESHPEKTEILSIKTVSFKTFYEMVERQEITDATSIAAVALAEKLL